MADTFRSEGKIYIVIAVMAVIFIGLIIYLISIDRKVSKIEKRINDGK
jgi:CcmD family protein